MSSFMEGVEAVGYEKAFMRHIIKCVRHFTKIDFEWDEVKSLAWAEDRLSRQVAKLAEETGLKMEFLNDGLEVEGIKLEERYLTGRESLPERSV